MDAKINGFNGEEHMKMQDEQLRDLFQQKLSGHESPVDPALWNSIQSGMSAPAGAVVTAAKTGFLKIASIITGIVVTGGIVGYYLLSETSTPQTTVAQNQEITVPSTTSTESQTKDAAFEQEKNTAQTPTSEETQKPVTILTEEDLPSDPETTEPKSVVPDPSAQGPNTEGPEGGKETSPPDPGVQESNNEDFTTEFNVVGTSDMGLQKMLIPAYTKGSAYRWTIDHGDPVYSELTTTYDFGTSGEHHILLEIEKTPGSGFTEYSEKTICVCPTAEVRIDYDLFTPNGDYYSRVFYPQIRSRNILPVRLLIFEKSTGKQIFEGLNENAKWDGTGPFGQEFPSGQYYYSFSATDLCGKKLVDKTGFIELQR